MPKLGDSEGATPAKPSESKVSGAAAALVDPYSAVK
tara:strand:+ start:366 stop:473 length:108 start_codon:yes stop_codon:yes gene_type:complete